MKYLSLAVAALAITAWTGFVQACFIHSPLPVELIEDHIEIQVIDNIAIKSYTCTFYNPNPQAVVGGTCYMEFEAGAQIDKLTLQLGDKEVEAEMLDAEKAKKVFQEIQARGGSPALLEFYGQGLIRAQVPNIPPQGTVVAKLRYTQVIKGESGLFRMQFLNTNPKAWLKPLKKVKVNATLRMTQPLKSIYSPTHNVTVTRIDDHNATVSYEQDNYLPKSPMALYWHVAGGEVGVSTMTYRDEEERGYFMMMMSPTIDPASVPVLPKEIVFCIDTSGSMTEDNRLAQVQKALKYCLSKLAPQDRFNIVNFGTESATFREGLIPATPENIERAQAHVDKFKARGRTAIEEATTISLGMFTDTPDPKQLLFLTDGQPTEGELDPAKLCEIIKRKNTKAARLFAFGVGLDLNTKLLDMMALDNSGSADYVLPRENLEQRITEFYDRTSSPVLSDIAVRFQDVKVEEIFPRRMPDLFKGQQIVLFGRYFVEDGSGSWNPEREVVVTGKLAGKDVSFSYKLNFPSMNPKNDYLPRVWAGRKVGWLLDEVKRNGQSKEVVDEIVRLAKQYGIVTPYTSFLVTDDVRPGAPADAYAAKARQALGAAESGGWRNADDAKKDRDLAEEMRGVGMIELAASSSGRTDTQVMERMRLIGPKTFYNVGGVWSDSAYDPEKHKEVVTVKPGSDELVKLLEEKPGLAKYLSLGNVTVLYQGKVYRVEP